QIGGRHREDRATLAGADDRGEEVPYRTSARAPEGLAYTLSQVQGPRHTEPIVSRGGGAVRLDGHRRQGPAAVGPGAGGRRPARAGRPAGSGWPRTGDRGPGGPAGEAAPARGWPG